MASFGSKRLSIQSNSSNTSELSLPLDTRRPSLSTASPASPISRSTSSPRVQLLPRSRTASYDISFSPLDMELLNSTSFDARDLSSHDFDFEDVFTYDKPQKKLKSVVEVTSSNRSRDWANLANSNAPSVMGLRQKLTRNRSTVGELYLKNGSDAAKRR